MELNEALELVRLLFFTAEKKHLNDIQSNIFRGAWEGKSYKEIAKDHEYQPGYIRVEASKLWSSLSRAVGEHVTRSNFRGVLERKIASQKSEQLLSYKGYKDIAFNDHKDNVVESSSVPESLGQNGKQQQGIYIPRPHNKVFGRDDLITTILSHLTDSQERHILSLSGPAGYGKTNAASCAASAAFTKKLFEDVLWVKARQSELVEGTITSETRAEALDWEQFCVEIAYQLKCPIEQVHQQLRENRLLIVIDNAETANIGSIFAQLVPMLNPSKALLTSRTNYEPRLVKQIPITGLDLESARQLILHEAKENNISVLLEAKNKQIEHIHQLTLGAPLALHFVVSRICHDEAISPVLHELERADKHVETFYKFTLETAWQRITEVARKIMLHVGEANSHVSHEELIGILSSKGFLESDLNAGKRDLKRWHLLEEKLHGESEKRRYDLHPWVRSCIRANLVNNWEPSLQDLRQRFKWKFDKE